jgi:hypothetical protein
MQRRALHDDSPLLGAPLAVGVPVRLVDALDPLGRVGRHHLALHRGLEHRGQRRHHLVGIGRPFVGGAFIAHRIERGLRDGAGWCIVLQLQPTQPVAVFVLGGFGQFLELGPLRIEEPSDQPAERVLGIGALGAGPARVVEAEHVGLGEPVQQILPRTHEIPQDRLPGRTDVDVVPAGAVARDFQALKPHLDHH